jgi:carboxyl-terminal processing protease
MQKVFLFLCVLFLKTTTFAETPKTSADTYRLLHMFNEAFRHARLESATPVSDEALIEGAIFGMMKTIDAHSYYIPQEQYKNMLQDFKGELEGIGLELFQENNQTKVITPFENSPAWHAGIKPGDQIVSINGTKVDGLSLLNISELLRGMRDETISLEITRKGILDTLSKKLKRQKIIMENVRWTLHGKTAYLRLSNFNHSHTSIHLKKALKEIMERNIKGIVLDLRNNPGGLLEEALKCANFFIEKAVIVKVQPREKEKTYSYETINVALMPSIPMIILINEGTASCAEIIAGALQDHQRALVMGSPSFGKGTVQSIFPLSPGYAAVQLTTAHYLTPAGRSIQSTGVQPDIFLKNTSSSQDTVKEEALKLLEAEVS